MLSTARASSAEMTSFWHAMDSDCVLLSKTTLRSAQAKAVTLAEAVRTRQSQSLHQAEARGGLQVKGEVKVSEYSSIDPEEYTFEVTVEGADSGLTAGANLRAAVQGLEHQLFSRLQQFVAELNAL